MTTQSKKRPFRTLLVVAILFILPAAALYFLKKGGDYRKELYGQMEDYGQMPPFNAAPAGTDTTSTAGKIVLVFFHGEKADEILRQLHQHFIEERDIVFLTYNAASAKELVNASVPDARWTAKLSALLPEKNLTDKAVLIDKKGHVRKIFDLTDAAQVDLLLRMTVLLIPVKAG